VRIMRAWPSAESRVKVFAVSGRLLLLACLLPLSCRASSSQGEASFGAAAGAAVECHGGDEIVLEDRTIESAGIGVEAHGGCTVTLVRCTIEAAVALELHGKSRAVIKDSTLRGGQAALKLHGASRVELANTRVEGRIKKHGFASLEDLGGNELE
jgi:hypothetical protein